WFSCLFFSSRRRHTRFDCDWSSDVCSSDLVLKVRTAVPLPRKQGRRDRRGASPDETQQRLSASVCSGLVAVRRNTGARGLPQERSEERRVGKEWICGLVRWDFVE